MNIRVIRPPERAHAVYTGGAVLAELMRDSEAFWVTRQEWHELGAQHCLDKLRRVKS
jgi:actin-related protein 2